MTAKTTKATAPSAEQSSPAPQGSETKPTELPDYVLDALELPTLTRWVPETSGDTIAGALISYDYREIPKLDGDGTRDVPVAIFHGISLSAAGEATPAGYVEVIGMSTVLERNLRRLHDAEVGTLVRINYLGKQPSPTKGHSDYADFDVAIGQRTDQVSLDILSNAPMIRELGTTMPELHPGEPF